MTLPRIIAASQVDAKSPVDDDLMQSIDEDLEYLDLRFEDVKTFDYEFKINGPLNGLASGSQRRRLDGAMISSAQTFTRCRLYLEQPGTSGSLEIDVRKYSTPNTVITALTRQYSQSINSISQVAPAIATQSISRFTAQILTQSISQWKTSVSISSIILLPNNLVRINLSSAVDTDWVIGDSITIAGATAGANNITTTIVRINDDGANNIIIANASAVAQTGAVGTIALCAWSYNFVNPVASTAFVAGEAAVFASHTAPANDGTLTIYAINNGGNNIVVKNALGVSQGGVAGSADCSRWKYTYSSSAPSDFVVGEYARMSGHTSGLNDGDFLIKAVNSSGNNIVVYNSAGVAQGGVAGIANTTRWIFSLPVDPTSSFTVGQSFVSSGTTSALNSGTFAVKEINRLATNNLVVSSASCIAQVGAAGTLAHIRMLVSFSSNQSSVYSTSSRVNLKNTASTLNLGEFDVKEVNRGGGSNFNVVIENATGVEQASPCGRINFASKSIFNTKPILTLPTSTMNSTSRELIYANFSDFGSEATTLAGDIIAPELTSVPNGAPTNCVIQLV